MTKRISCFVLALVMVLLSVPVFAFSALAVEVPYTTAWKDNLPTYGTAEEGYPVAYPGFWSIGSIALSNYSVFNLFDSDTAGDHVNGLITTANNDPQWTVGGMYVFGQGGRAEQMITTNDYYTAVRYVAEYTGSVTVDVANLMFSNAQNAEATAAMHAFAIVKNGEIVWPSGATFADETNWFSSTKFNENVAGDIDLSGLSLTLTQGDNLDFVFRKTAYAKTLGNSSWAAYDFAPSVTYTEAEEGAALGKIYNSSYTGDVSFSAPNNKDNGEQPLLYADWVAAQPETADTSAEAYGEYFQSFGKITFTGAWSNGIVDPASGAYERIARRYYFADKKMDTATSWDMNWGVTESYWQSGLATFIGGGQSSPWNTNAGVMRVDVLACTQPATANALYAYAYEAPANGTVSVSFEKIASPKAAMRIAVLVDGFMVWPTVGGALDTAANFYNVAANTTGVTETVNALLADVSFYAKEGSLVQVVVGKGAWAGSNPEDGGNSQGFVVKPSVKLVESTEEKAIIIYKSNTGAILGRFACNIGDSFPTVDALAVWDIDGDGEEDVLPATVTEDMTVQAIAYFGRDAFAASAPALVNNAASFKGYWTIGGGNWSGADLTLDGLTWTNTELFTKYDGYAFVGEVSNSLWGANGGGMYPNRRFATKTAPTGIGAIYTAPTSGYVSLSIEALTGSREISAGDERYEIEAPLAYYISILKNGEVVWPADGSAFLFETKEKYTGTGQTFDFLAGTADTMTAVAPAMPDKLYVAEGDEIAFVANMGNEYSWMLFMDPVVTYTELVEAPSFEYVQPTLGDGIAIDMYVNAGGATGTVGAFVNGEFVEAVYDEDLESYGLLIDKIYARQMTDAYTLVPAVEVSEGEYITGSVMETSFADLIYESYILPFEGLEDAGLEDAGLDGEFINALLVLKNVAIASLNYGAAAQNYFGYNTDKLANAMLTDAQKEVTVAGEYTDNMTVTETEGATVEFEGATLLLQNRIALKLTFENCPEDITGYTVEASTESFGYTSVELQHCAEGKNCKAIIYLPDILITETLEIVVKDAEGNAVSDVLTYDVASYFVRMSDNEDIAVLGQAVAAYAEALTAFMESMMGEPEA